MRHRGPDWSGVYASDKAILAHERLSIVDVNAGAQPLYNAEKPMRWPLTARSTTTSAARGVWRSLSVPDRFRLRSDPRAVSGKGPEFLDDLQGMFAFALYDSEKTRT